MQPSELTSRCLDALRRDFYRGREKAFFQQRDLLLTAISYPARWLADRGVDLPAERYEAIVTGIVAGVRRHGNVRAVRFFSRYLLTAVQQHMAHHGDEYYAEGKSARNAVDSALHGLRKAAGERPTATREADKTVSTLAELHRVLTIRKRSSLAAATPKQGTLL